MQVQNDEPAQRECYEDRDAGEQKDGENGYSKCNHD